MPPNRIYTVSDIFREKCEKLAADTQRRINRDLHNDGSLTTVFDKLLKENYEPYLLDQINNNNPLVDLFREDTIMNAAKQAQNGYGIGQGATGGSDPRAGYAVVNRKLTVRERQTNAAAHELFMLLINEPETLERYQEFQAKLKKQIGSIPERLLRGVLLEVCGSSRATRRELRSAGMEIERYRVERNNARTQTEQARSAFRRLKNALEMAQAIGGDLEIE